MALLYGANVFFCELMISFSSQYLFFLSFFFFFFFLMALLYGANVAHRQTERQRQKDTHTHTRTHARTHARTRTHTHAHRHQPRVFVVLLRFEELIPNLPFVLRLSH